MIKGSGPGGRITVADVENASVVAAPAAVGTPQTMQAAPAPPPPPRTVVTEGTFSDAFYL